MTDRFAFVRRILPLWGFVFSLGAFAVVASAAANAPSAPNALKDPTYAALRAARPDGRTITVENLVLDRDVYHFEFTRGTFHLLTPVEGRTWGAVFLGEGKVRLTPATPNERRRLAISSGGDPATFEVLNDTFSRLVLWTGEDALVEIAQAAETKTGTPDPKAIAALEEQIDRQKKKYRTNFHLRVLADLLDVPGLTSGALLAFFDGAKLGPALAAIDPHGADALRIGGFLGHEDSLLWVADDNKGGAWYLSETAGELKSPRRSLPFRAVDATHYEVETTVAKDEDVAGQATVHFEVRAPKLRVLAVNLQGALRLSSASFAPEGDETWTEIAFIQEAEKEDNDVAVVFPRTVTKGEKLRLRFAYAGDKVLVDQGDKNYAVLSRISWYPNLGFFSDNATFDLTYRVPLGNQILSVGNPVETKTEGNSEVSLWKATKPIAVAGFNYGKFKKVEQKDEISGIGVEVWTNPGTPDIIREINSYLSSSTSDFYSDEESAGVAITGPSLGPSLGKVDTGKLAKAALADGVNSARLFATYFGPLPFERVAITQQAQWSFGQSWPALIYMPYVSFLDGTQRRTLGFGGGLQDFVDSVGFHEFAHQWWGHRLGWESYRDQWLSEGFAEFSAALAIQHTQGWKQYDDFWREARKRIVEKVPGNAMPPYEAGAISDGYRSASQRTPTAPFALIYSKGGYVLHMIRMAMYDPRSKDPDAAFIAMMRDFTQTFDGKNPSTADFQKIAEKHIVPMLDATRDGKLDWFFNQWVHGTEVPKLTSKIEIEKVADGFRLHGTVTQSEVSADFRTLVPLYVEMEKNQFAQVGLLPMVGSGSKPVDAVLKLPKKPRRALVNARGEVLARD